MASTMRLKPAVFCLLAIGHKRTGDVKPRSMAVHALIRTGNESAGGWSGGMESEGVKKASFETNPDKINLSKNRVEGTRVDRSIDIPETES